MNLTSPNDFLSVTFVFTSIVVTDNLPPSNLTFHILCFFVFFTVTMTATVAIAVARRMVTRSEKQPVVLILTPSTSPTTPVVATVVGKRSSFNSGR